MAAGVLTSLALMAVSLAAMQGRVLNVTQWPTWADEPAKGQLVPDAQRRGALNQGTPAPSQAPSGNRGTAAAAITPSAPPATAAPTPLGPRAGGGDVPEPAAAVRTGTSFVNNGSGVPLSDTDGDGLPDIAERILHTGLRNTDSDRDGIPDGWEVRYGLDPLDAGDAVRDLDGDGVDNRNEYLVHANPTLTDSNRDGTPDGQDDPDRDGVPTAVEQRLALNPSTATSARSRSVEAPRPTAAVEAAGVAPLVRPPVPTDGQRDTDGDGIPNAVEVRIGLDPVSTRTNNRDDSTSDVDRDGLANALEIKLALDPGSPDSDGDGVLDGEEDSDADGLSNSLELQLSLDPSRKDTDGNGVLDGAEDSDGDGLYNLLEISLDSDPAVPNPKPDPPAPAPDGGSAPADDQPAAQQDEPAADGGGDGTGADATSAAPSTDTAPAGE